MNEATKYNRAKTWQIALFALNMMSTNMYLFLMMYVSYYANGILGMSVVFVSTLATSMRIFDGFTDPIIGWLIDHTNGRFGKFRPFLVVGNALLALSMILLYKTTHLVPEALQIPYFIVVYALYIIGYTVQGTVTTSAQTLLTNDPKQRPIYGFFTGFFMLFLQTGIIMLVSNYLVPKYGGMTLEFFREIIVWVIAIAFVLMICSLIAIAPKDKPVYYNSMVKNKEEKVSFKTYWEVLKHNRALQMLVISESTDKLASSIAGNSIVGVMLYGIIIGDYAVMGRLSAITMIPNIILLVIGIMGARQAGQKKTYVATVYGCIAVQLAITLLLIFGDPTKIDLKSFGFMNIAFVVLIIALNGIRNIGSNMMIPMMADCTDYEVYRSGHYVPGLIATVYSFIDKLISSFATTAVGAFVAVIGYKNSVPQVGDASTPEILMITILLFCGMPILGWIASIIAMKFYPLTGEKMKEIEEETWGIRVSFHNNTDKNQNCLINYFAAEEYPKSRVYTKKVPEKSDAWNAVDYENLEFGKAVPWEHLNLDAMKKGEILVDGFTDDNGLGMSYYALFMRYLGLKAFGGNQGDKVSYQVKLKESYQDAVLAIRYRTLQDEGDVIFQSNIGTIHFAATKESGICYVPIGKISDKEFIFKMEAFSEQSNGIMLDFLCVCEKSDKKEVGITEEVRNVIPKVECENDHIKYQYNYKENPIYLSILSKRVRSRKLYSGCIEDALVSRLANSDATYDNLTRSFSGAFQDKHSDEGFYHINVAEALFVPGKSVRTEYAYISTKERNYSKAELEIFWKQCRSIVKKENCANEEGNPFEFTGRMMKSALYSNIVYPIRRHGEYIAHYTPGKRWDSLYTWDSGFIGLGMLDYSSKLAEYVMDTYLSEPDNTDFAFVAHGSLVPTQFYLYYEILNRADAKERENLKKYYPMFLRYYRYMAGRTEESTMSRLGNGLLTVYDYFYNASGMDDYPPQVELHRKNIEQVVSPVCSNVHFIRIAKFMKQISMAFGYEENLPEFEQDIERVKNALLAYAWDEESGYFGYAVQGQEGVHILRTEAGENYNKGVDGVTPLIAGICSKEQEKQLLKHLKSPEELWSPVGISTVDMSASYYYDNGYWNGSVWCPYQYFLWKAMLDIGEGQFAFDIAHRGLNSWKQEIEFSYNTFEMIQIETERGGWFHQFSGLSTPISIWYNAYYKRGTLTTGYDTWIEKKEISEDVDHAEIVYSTTGTHTGALLIVMNSLYHYDVEIDGKKAEFIEREEGVIEITLNRKEGVIIIYRDEK